MNSTLNWPTPHSSLHTERKTGAVRWDKWWYCTVEYIQVESKLCKYQPEQVCWGWGYHCSSFPLSRTPYSGYRAAGSSSALVLCTVLFCKLLVTPARLIQYLLFTVRKKNFLISPVQCMLEKIWGKFFFVNRQIGSFVFMMMKMHESERLVNPCLPTALWSAVTQVQTNTDERLSSIHSTFNKTSLLTIS